jgi:hypothetical protein
MVLEYHVPFGTMVYHTTGSIDRQLLQQVPWSKPVRTNGALYHGTILVRTHVRTMVRVPRWYTFTNITVSQKRLEIQALASSLAIAIVWQYAIGATVNIISVVRTMVPVVPGTMWYRWYVRT